MLRTIAGLHPARRRQRHAFGRRLDGEPVEALVRQGLVLVPEGRATLRHLTVRENLVLGAYVRRDGEIEADLSECSDCSRAWPSGWTRRRAPCPGASSRCSPSAAR